MYRPADQEALRQVAITAAQKLELRNGFHSLSRYFNIEAARHGDGGTNNSLVAAIEFNVLYQGLVKNEAVDNARIQRAERRHLAYRSDPATGERQVHARRAVFGVRPTVGPTI